MKIKLLIIIMFVILLAIIWFINFRIYEMLISGINKLSSLYLKDIQIESKNSELIKFFSEYDLAIKNILVNRSLYRISIIVNFIITFIFIIVLIIFEVKKIIKKKK